MSRFRLIQPHLEKNQPLQTVAADGKVPFRTAQRWVSQYRKFGLIALIRKPRVDRGARRVISPKLKAAIEALALESPPLPVRSIWRQIRQFAETIGEPPPRYGLVYDLVREIPVGLLTLAHRGGKTYSDKFDLVHRREAPRSNAIWQADHAQLGIRLVREDGQIAKPWLTIVIDDYSRAMLDTSSALILPPRHEQPLLFDRQSGERAIRTGRCAVSLKCFIPTMARISSQSTSNRSLSISRSNVCSQHQESRKGVAASNASSEPSTKCFFASLMDLARKGDVNPTFSSSNLRRFSGHSFLRPTIDKPAPPLGRLPRRAGRKAGFCLACPSLSLNLICCSCKR